MVAKVLMKDLITGLRRTFYYFFTKPITVQYPKEKLQPFPRFRGFIRLVKDEETGRYKCIACGQCARVCPAQCISLKGEGKGKERQPVEFNVDFSRCIYCGFCVEVCPVDALENSKFYEGAQYDVDWFKFDINKLSEDYSKWERTFKK